MSAQRYFPNGNPDYETDWIIERNMGWFFMALAVIGFLVDHYWIEHVVVIMFSATSWGIGFTMCRLAILGREQAETLQEREGEIDWALDKLRDNNIEY